MTRSEYCRNAFKMLTDKPTGKRLCEDLGINGCLVLEIGINARTWIQLHNKHCYYLMCFPALFVSRGLDQLYCLFMEGNFVFLIWSEGQHLKK